MNKLNCLFVILVCLGALNAHGATTKKAPAPLESDHAALKKAQEAIAKRGSIVASFRQETYRKLRGRTTIANGTVYFIQPNRFSWQLKTPFEQHWIFDGKKLAVYDPPKKEATVYGKTLARGKEVQLLLDLILRFDVLVKHYAVRSLKRNKQLLELTMTPHTPGEIAEVRVSYDLDRNYVRTVKLSFSGGNASTFTFQDVKPTTASAEVLTLPKNTKIHTVS